jgi:uncharacterized protein YkwD
MPQYKIALETACKAHLARIKELHKGENPLTEQDAITRQLDDERKRVMALIQTDYKKNNAKIKMLRNEMEGLIALSSKREKAIKRDASPLLTSLNDSLDALCSLTRELEKFNPQQETRSLNDTDLRAHFIKDSIEAEHLMQMQASWNKSKNEYSRLAETEKLNAATGNWCSASMKSFATILNHERVVIGLQPLQIAELLSAAAAGHSSDMASGGFFDHESPVPNKKWPQDRAKLAKFNGRVTGENIFMGSTSSQEAFDAWFGSDGHRFIMFADGPNCCGIGISGVHWTLMTGHQ